MKKQITSFITLLLILLLTTIPFTVGLVGQPPVADANGPYTAYEWETVTLDGSGSNDPEGTIVDYEWDLDNDGSFDDVTGVTPSISASTWGEGTHTISLRVTDEQALEDIDSTTVTIYPLPVSKDATTSYTRTHSWDITKDVSPEELLIPEGSTGTADYTITVNHYVIDSDYAVSGTITIDNPSGTDVTITGVSDVLSDSTVASVSGATFPYVISAGGSMSLSYSASLSDMSATLNTVTVSAEPSITSTATAVVSFDAPTTIVGYSEIHVSDTNGQSWITSDTLVVN